MTRNKHRDIELSYFSIPSFFDLSRPSRNEERANACLASNLRSITLTENANVATCRAIPRFLAPRLSRHRPDGYIRGDLVTVCPSTLFNEVTIFEAPMRDCKGRRVSKHRSQIRIGLTYNKCGHIIVRQRYCPIVCSFHEMSA